MGKILTVKKNLKKKVGEINASLLYTPGPMMYRR